MFVRREGMNMERSKNNTCLCTAVVEIVCIFVYVHACPLCCVYFERTVAWSKWYFFLAVPLWRWVASGKHGVVYDFSLGLGVGLIPGSWLSFSLVPYNVWLVPSTACPFQCVFIRFSYAEQVFNNFILQIIILMLSHWSFIPIAYPGKGLL